MRTLRRPALAPARGGAPALRRAVAFPRAVALGGAPAFLRAVALAAALALPPAGAPAAQEPDPARRAYALEQRGAWAEAAELYRSVLGRDPANLPALFGLERSLLALNRLPEILPQVRAALAARPKVGAFYALALRAWTAAGQPDSVRATAERWAAVEPGSEAPYREWGTAALSRQDRAAARRAYLTGRERLGRPDALAPELAQLASQERDWPIALREWVAAVSRVPGYRGSAVAALAAAPEPARADLLAALERTPSPAARRLEADLRTRWGDPLGGFEVLSRSLGGDSAGAEEALHGFLEQVRSVPGAPARRAEGLALAALAERRSGPAATRLRLDAARALADGGDQAGARRLLDAVGRDSTSPAGLSSDAAVALVSVLLSEGKVDEAERKLRELAGSIPGGQRDELRRRLAWGLLRAGRLGSADSLVAADSSVEGLALAGYARLFRGDVAGAVRRFQEAGPFAGTREEATARTALLAMLQPIEADTLPELGRALLALAQGDTATALAGLERVAAALPPDRGGAEVRLYAGLAARRAGRAAEAERFFRAASVPEAKAAAPAAELALARLLVDQGRRAEAVPLLEHLILTYPESALVPQARRTLDEARGAVPPT